MLAETLPAIAHKTASPAKRRRASTRPSPAPPTVEELLARLNARQRRFVEALTGGTLRSWGRYGRAAALAGYAWPERQGSRLMSMARVRAAVDAIEAIRTAEWRVRWRKEMRERLDARDAKPTPYRRKGKGAGRGCPGCPRPRRRIEARSSSAWM